MALPAGPRRPPGRRARPRPPYQMTKPRSAAGAVIHTGELAGRAAQQPAGAPKTTGAATTIQGHWSGRAESHEGIVSGSIGANPRSHQGNGTTSAITGASTSH